MVCFGSQVQRTFSGGRGNSLRVRPLETLMYTRRNEMFKSLILF